MTPPTQLLQMLQRMQIPDGDASKQAALLDALKPFVTPTHKKRLEKALQLSRLSQMAGLALQELEQDNSV